MNRLFLLLLSFLFVCYANAQTGYLFVKKGIHKKKIYTEGSTIHLRLADETIRSGMITRLMNDTIYVSGIPVPRIQVKEVLLINRKNRFHLDAGEILLITGGVALVTAGLTLSNQASFKDAAIAGVVIGYGPLALGYLKSKISFRRKRYRIGKKFRLQVLDFYLPRLRAF